MIPPHSGKDHHIRSCFDTAGCYIFRDLGKNFALFTKGGTNYEPHNHNDLGSFVVSSFGEQLIADVGFTPYTNKTFSSERYQEPALSSFGHSVPVVRGRLQHPELFSSGEYNNIDSFATVTEKHFSEKTEQITYDLKNAYQIQELLKLERAFEFQRGDGIISVKDNFEYSGEGDFAASFTTYSIVKIIATNEFELIGKKAALRVQVLHDDVTIQISGLEGVVVGDHDVPVNPIHILVGLNQKVKKGELIYRISQVDVP